MFLSSVGSPQFSRCSKITLVLLGIFRIPTSVASCCFCFWSSQVQIQICRVWKWRSSQGTKKLVVICGSLEPCGVLSTTAATKWTALSVIGYVQTGLCLLTFGHYSVSNWSCVVLVVWLTMQGRSGLCRTVSQAWHQTKSSFVWKMDIFSLTWKFFRISVQEQHASFESVLLPSQTSEGHRISLASEIIPGCYLPFISTWISMYFSRHRHSDCSADTPSLSMTFQSGGQIGSVRSWNEARSSFCGSLGSWD